MTEPAQWAVPPAHLTLADDALHVWRASLPLAPQRLQALRQTLSPDEIERAERFRFPVHREHFIAARGQLRAIVSRYLGIEPAQIPFRYSDHRKPSLAVDTNIQFNLSHSRDLVLYAFTRNRELGVDIEWINAEFASDDVARHYFSPNEYAQLNALPEAIRHEVFFTIWTRKEAYIKAHGAGLSLPLHDFDVTVQPGEAPQLLASRIDPQEVQRWSMAELHPHPEYKATVMAERQDWQLHCWSFTP